MVRKITKSTSKIKRKNKSRSKRKSVTSKANHKGKRKNKSVSSKRKNKGKNRTQKGGNPTAGLRPRHQTKSFVIEDIIKGINQVTTKEGLIKETNKLTSYFILEGIDILEIAKFIGDEKYIHRRSKPKVIDGYVEDKFKLMNNIFDDYINELDDEGLLEFKNRLVEKLKSLLLSYSKEERYGRQAIIQKFIRDLDGENAKFVDIDKFEKPEIGDKKKMEEVSLMSGKISKKDETK